MYSERAKRLIKELPNCGTLSHPSHTASVSNPICGDEIELFLKVRGQEVSEVRYKVRGCPAAMAAAAALSLLIQGHKVESCLNLDTTDLTNYLKGLPSHKKHAVELALEALNSALNSSS